MATVNGFDPAALSIDGARHPGEIWRVGLYASTSGDEGVVEGVDCRVTQLSTPGGGVAISAGAVLVRNRSASVRNQTYAANGRVGSTVDVTATGASGRSDLVVIRIKDPQYSPWQALSGPTTQYVEPFVIQNVPAGTETAASLNLGYSAVALARLDIPANTTIITNTMIKDVRKLPRPRRERHVMVQLPGVTSTSPAPGGSAQFTNLNNGIAIPSWASEVKIIVLAGQLQYTGAMTGRLRAELGPLITQESGLASDSGPFRTTVVMAGEVAIPANLRGTTQNIRLTATGVSGAGRLISDQWTTLVIDTEFVEKAD
jgi:hypothetical protein